MASAVNLTAETFVPTIESDGSDVTNVALPGFPKGLFVAMSNGKVFHFYSWDDIAGANKAPAGVPTAPAAK